MQDVRYYVAYAITAVSGFAIWIIIPAVTGDPEAWNSGLYYKVAIPLITLECGLLGFILPNRWWHWGLVVSAAQAIFIIAKWPTSNLMPPSLIFLFVLSIPYLVGGYLGALISKKFGGKKDSEKEIEKSG